MPSDADPLKYGFDTLRAAERISQFVAGRTFEEYLNNDMLRSAVERQFEIIGEALNALRRHAPEAAARVLDLPPVVAFRNLPIHGYASINDALVRDVATTELPGLIGVLKSVVVRP